MRERLLVLLEIPIILIIVYQLWTKAFPVWVYFLASVSLGILIALAISTGREHKGFVIVQVALLGLLARNIYFLSTHYSVIPFGDPYGQYQVADLFLREGHASIIPQADMYSGWPAIQVLSIALSEICNINLLNLVLVMPWIFCIGWFIFSYLLLQKMCRDLGVSNQAFTFALLVLVTAPTVFMVPVFKYQEMALLLLAILLYLMYKQITKPSATNSALPLIVVSSLVITHHYTSFVTAVYLILVSVIILSSNAFSTRTSPRFLPETKFSARALYLGAILIMLIFLWWNSYASLVWSRVGPAYITQFLDVLKRAAFEAYLPGTDAPAHPASFTPNWAQILLVARDVVIFITAVVGFVLLWLDRKKMPQKSFILYSLLIAALLLVVDVFIVWAGPWRAIGFFVPFLVLLIGIFYDKLKTKWKGVSTGLIVIVTILLVFSSLVAPWSHLYIPAHLYDPRVSWIEGGEHPTDWRRLEGFWAEYIAGTDVNHVLTDDIYIVSLFVPLEERLKITPVESKDASITGNTLVVALRQLHPSSYITSTVPGKCNPDYDESKFREEVDTSCNLVYRDGVFEIWRAR